MWKLHPSTISTLNAFEKYHTDAVLAYHVEFPSKYISLIFSWSTLAYILQKNKRFVIYIHIQDWLLCTIFIMSYVHHWLCDDIRTTKACWSHAECTSITCTQSFHHMVIACTMITHWQHTPNVSSTSFCNHIPDSIPMLSHNTTVNIFLLKWQHFYVIIVTRVVYTLDMVGFYFTHGSPLITH